MTSSFAWAKWNKPEIRAVHQATRGILADLRRLEPVLRRFNAGSSEILLLRNEGGERSPRTLQYGAPVGCGAAVALRLRRRGAPGRPADPRRSPDLTDVAGAAVDLARAGLRCGSLTVTTDGATALTLLRLRSGSRTVELQKGTTILRVCSALAG